VETLTFLFTDIEGSTVLLRRVGQEVYAQILAGHHALIRSALAAQPRARLLGSLIGNRDEVRCGR
jgi:class 3 adenylate cyclase